MKKLLLKLLGIEELLQDAHARGYAKAITENLEAQARVHRANYPIGLRVICFSNCAPAKLAKVVQNDDLLLEDEGTGELFQTMGVIVPYDEERYKALMKLEWWEQWNVVTRWAATLTAEKAAGV